MKELMPFLLARGVVGSTNGDESRLLAWLADRDVNRKVFGQPLSGVLDYYLPDVFALLTIKSLPSARPAEQSDTHDCNGIR
jgi:hypothetical protein